MIKPGVHKSSPIIYFLTIALLLLAFPKSFSQNNSTQMKLAHPLQRAQQDDHTDSDTLKKEGKKDKDDPCEELPPGEAKGRKKKCLPQGSSSGIAKGDFNGDDIADLAVGVPGEDTPSNAPNAGAVIVIYGSDNGLTAPTSAGVIPQAQFWSQNTPGVPGGSEPFDRFGSALAAGDFNADGFSDLAIGIPGEDINRDGTNFEDSGGVVTIYGSSAGLTATSTAVPAPQFIDFGNDASRIVGGEHLGAALAWGDFNEDGVGDLAAGAPDADVIQLSGPTIQRGSTLDAAGLVWIFPGVRGAGLSLSRTAYKFLRGRGAGDSFGAALTAGGYGLAVGVPNQDFDVEGSASFIRDGGLVRVFDGRSDFFNLDSEAQFNGSVILRGYPNPPGSFSAFQSPASDDHYGSVLATGDFDGNGTDEIAVGVPDREVSRISNAGVVVIHNAPLFENNSNGDQVWHQNNIFTSANSLNSSEAGDRFGSSLAAGDFNGDGRKDLAIGVPFESIISFRTGSAQNVIEAGEVDVIYGSPSGLSISVRDPQSWDQDDVNIEEIAEQEDHFGWSLSAWNFGKGAQADLAIGVPFEDLQRSGSSQVFGDAGGVNVIYGSPPGNTQSASNGLTSFGDQFWSQDTTGVPGDIEAGDLFGKTLY